MAKKAKKAKKSARRPENRFQELIDLQLEAIQYWGEYAQNAAKLMSKGTFSPVPWTDEYKKVTSRVVEDFGKFVGILAGDKR
jgi:hypothetical protein